MGTVGFICCLHSLFDHSHANKMQSRMGECKLNNLCASSLRFDSMDCLGCPRIQGGKQPLKHVADRLLHNPREWAASTELSHQGKCAASTKAASAWRERGFSA